MNRYWDLEEADRAKLTADQVEAFLNVELMEVGVTKPREPDLMEVEELTIETEEWFKVSWGPGIYDRV